MSKQFRFLTLILSLSWIMACEQRNESPKPRAYPKIEYPERSFQAYSNPGCPFTFEYPSYATTDVNTKSQGIQADKTCWFDLVFEPFDARLHVSYHPVDSEARLSKLMSDAFTMADRINQRSNYMDEMQIQNQYGSGGLVMEFAGRAASPMHFFLTDSTNHFLKASLYFNSRVNPDSLAPIAEFVKEDVAVFINTLDWN